MSALLQQQDKTVRLVIVSVSTLCARLFKLRQSCAALRELQMQRSNCLRRSKVLWEKQQVYPRLEQLERRLEAIEERETWEDQQ